MLIIIIWIFVSIVTHKLNRNSDWYWFIIFCHLIFMIFAVLLLIEKTITGFTRDYGKSFFRKIVVIDPATKKQKTIQDDGTFVISNGRVTGRINIDEARRRDE